MTPEDRATLEWAYRVVLGYSAEDEVFVLRDLTVITATDRATLDPSSCAQDALIVALAQTMKLRMTGVQLGELRRDLLAAGMREEAANRVHDHLTDVSVGAHHQPGSRPLQLRALQTLRADLHLHGRAVVDVA